MENASSSPLADRSSGVLLHVTSLPGPHGIGDLGPTAYRWVDLLSAAGQRWWQVLPLGPTGAGHSPYQSFSAFAGNPLLISLEALVADGLLTKAQIATARQPAGPVDYPRVAQAKYALLAAAHERFARGGAKKLAAEYRRFQARQRAWLSDFTLFMALREAHGDADWADWPADLVARKPAALAKARAQFHTAIDRTAFLQFLFYRQFIALRDHARARHVQLLGDLPIFISDQSSDVWANPTLFELDKNGRPLAVAGVPPDMFSKTGQRWGNPLYDWQAMKRQRFAWWVARLRAALQQTDLVRLDHFRGFDAYWRIPAGNPTAERGRWVKAPGAELFEAFRKEFRGLPVVAEDLGLITPTVEKLRDRFGLPGMRVLQFAFDGGGDNVHLPHNCSPNSVIYTGTHDNDTTAGWFASLKPRDQRLVVQYALASGRAVDVVWSLIRLAWAGPSRLAIAPAQDVMALPSSARMNTPGTDEGNWRWRLDSFQMIQPGLKRLGELTKQYNRQSVKPKSTMRKN